MGVASRAGVAGQSWAGVAAQSLLLMICEESRL